MAEAILVKGNYTGTLSKENVHIPVSNWALDTEASADYRYKGTIDFPGITSKHIPEVIFSLEDATSGNFAPICDSGENVVYVWASSIPETEIVVSVIRASLA